MCMTNYIMHKVCFTINPYLDGHLWMFDDPKVGLLREGLRRGTPEVLVRACELRGMEPVGFVAAFSVTNFVPMHRLDLLGPLWHGTEYHWDDQQMTCWFCPALLRYFSVPPQELYFCVWSNLVGSSSPAGCG